MARQHPPATTPGKYPSALYILAGMMLVSTIVPLIGRPPRVQAAAPKTDSEPLQAREVGR
ncbi:MAG: hypothetical protein CYG59_21710 [Chloroflexi bacterium]|nr:MAG: hypothetical protein CYG59_21710 [Chloroflexota bacterium]